MIKSFGQVLDFEFKRFRCKRSVIVFVVLILISISIIQISGSNYQKLLKARETFQETEKQRVKEYLNYTYYGWYGLTVFLIPPNSSIFFTNNMTELFGNVNTGERLTIVMPIKGKTSIPDIPGYMNLSCIIMLFWTFVSLLYGYDTIKTKDYKKFLRQLNWKSSLFMVISRIILLNMALLAALIISASTALINNINPFKAHLLIFTLQLCLVSLVFFLMGLNFGNIRNKAAGLAVLGLLYFVLVLFFPWLGNEIKSNAFDVDSLARFELKNLKIVMDLEERAFKKIGNFKSGDIAPKDVMEIVWKAIYSEFRELRERENKMKMQVQKKIKTFQIISSFFPINFYLEVNREISGYGDLGIIDFHSYLQRTKDRFLYFYVKKKFLSKSKPQEVEDFVKNNENLFFAKSRLPHGFWLGVGITVLYIAALLFLAYRLHLGKSIKEERGGLKGDLNVNIDFKGNNTVFVLCKNEAIKRKIFNHYHYQSDQGAVCLEKINPADFTFNGINPAALLEHLSRAAGVDERKARESLAIMGVDINAVIARKTRRKLRSFEDDGVDESDTAGKEKDELILKIYAAVIMADNRQIIVIDEFLKRESKRFERDCYKLLSSLLSAGKKIIYLSTEMYQTFYNLDEKIKAEMDDYGVWPIKDEDLAQITLR